MSRRLRIGVVVPGWSGPAAAPALPALQDLLAVAAGSHDIRVVALRHPARTSGYVDAHGIPVTPLGRGTAAGPIGRAAVLAAGVRALRRLHAAAPFDVLHAFWVDEPGAVAVVAGRLLGVPVVASVMGGELAAHASIGYGAGLGWGGRLTTEVALGRADLVTVGSSWLGDVIAGRAPGAPLRCMPLGVDLERFHPAATRPAGARLVFAGSLVPVKDPALLLRAAARVQTPGAELTIAGDGPLRPGLERLVVGLGLGSRVRFLGAVPRDRMADVVRDAHVLVVSSHHEAQSMVAVEAAASGLPVVGTAVGVVPELARAGGGIAVDDREPASLAMAIDRILGSSDASWGAAARHYAVHTWDLAAAGRALTATWQELAGVRDAP